jgi:hypothetical protein
MLHADNNTTNTTNNTNTNTNNTNNMVLTADCRPATASFTCCNLLPAALQGAGVQPLPPLLAMQMCLVGCQLKMLHITWLSVLACSMYVCGTRSCFCQTC